MKRTAQGKHRFNTNEYGTYCQHPSLSQEILDGGNYLLIHSFISITLPKEANLWNLQVNDHDPSRTFGSLGHRCVCFFGKIPVVVWGWVILMSQDPLMSYNSHAPRNARQQKLDSLFCSRCCGSYPTERHVFLMGTWYYSRWLSFLLNALCCNQFLNSLIFFLRAFLSKPSKQFESNWIISGQTVYSSVPSH